MSYRFEQGKGRSALNKQLAIAAVIMWLALQGSVVFSETITSSEYFPLEAGNTWTYRVTDSYGTYTITHTVLPGTRLVNGVQTRIISDNSGDQAYYTSDQEGIRLHGFHFVPEDYIYFRPPIVQGEGTMQIPGTAASAGIAEFVLGALGTYWLNYTAAFTVEGKETITVPAGTYVSLRVSYYMRLFGEVLGTVFDESTTGTDWNARYVGNIKEVAADEGGTTTYELISTNVKPPVDERSVFLPFLPLLLD